MTILEDLYVRCKICNAETLREDVDEEGICRWCRVAGRTVFPSISRLYP